MDDLEVKEIHNKKYICINKVRNLKVTTIDRWHSQGNIRDTAWQELRYFNTYIKVHDPDKADIMIW